MSSKQKMIFESTASRLKPPCKDCEERSITCHGTCKAYLEYEVRRNEAYEEKLKKQQTIKVDKRRRVW